MSAAGRSRTSLNPSSPPQCTGGLHRPQEPGARGDPAGEPRGPQPGGAGLWAWPHGGVGPGETPGRPAHPRHAGTSPGWDPGDPNVNLG